VKQAGSFGTGVALAVLVLAAPAAAKTIVGTARADVLKGTPGADAIFGRAGNDRLFGRGGNDRLHGGAGADRISCGRGRDTVVADARDMIAADCEIVRRPKPPSPPPPAPTPPTPPPPPAPPPAVVPGHYVARTGQERYVHLEVYPDGRALTNLRVEYEATCTPPPPLTGPYVDVVGDIAIDSERTFSVDTAPTGGPHVSVQGTFDGEGNLAGSFRVQTSVETGGTRRECDSGTVPFRGNRR
jgi:hypothetical protein